MGHYRPGTFEFWCGGVISYICMIFISGTLPLSITPPGDNVVAGRPFTLQCRINREEGNRDLAYWERVGSSGIILASRSCASVIVQPGFLGGCERVGDQEDYSLTIVNVTVDMDNSNWICSRQTNVGLLTVNVTLNVKVMVTSVTLVTRPVSVLAGTANIFTCTTSPSKPRACIKWYLQQQGTTREITTGQPACNQDFTLKTTTQSHRFTATPDDNGVNLYCTATNRVTDTPVHSQDYILNVQYPPRTSLGLTGYVTGEPIKSGQTITLTCNVGEANPSPTPTWSPDCGNNAGIQSTIPSVPKSLNGKSCVCRGTQDGSLTGWRDETSVTFNVTFGPDRVTLEPNTGLNGDRVSTMENDTLTFNCTSGESNPASIISLYNNNIPVSNIPIVYQTRGPNNGYIVSAIYKVRPTPFIDGNDIRCEALRPGQITPESFSLLLDVSYKPRITCDRSQLKLFEGQHVILICVLQSKPVPVITWTKDGIDIGQKYKTQMNQTSSPYSLSSQVSIPFTGASESGVFTITAENSVGSSHKDIVIDVIEGQTLPQDVKVTFCRNGQAELIWPSGISTTVFEYYRLESRQSQTEWEGILVRNPGQGRLVEKILTNLKNGVPYEFRVQPNTDVAFSEFARTNCTVDNIGITNVEEKLSCASEITGAGIGVGIVVGVAIVGIVGIAFWMFRCRNHSSPTGAECVVKKDRDGLSTPPGEDSIPTTNEGASNYENMDRLEVGHYEEITASQSATGPSYDSLTMDFSGLSPATGQQEHMSAYENTSAL